MVSYLLAKKRDELDLRGRRLLVVGLAREGTALARYLSGRGASVVATDLKPARAFADALRPLSDADVKLVLGEHPSNLLDDCELAFISPGVPFDAPFLNQARARGSFETILSVFDLRSHREWEARFTFEPWKRC